MDEPKMREQIAHILTHVIVQDANPGFPLACHYAENQLAVQILGSEFIIDVTMARIKLLLNCDVSKLTPEEIIQQGLADPIRAFIKNEPHPPRKQLTKRWRIISSVSLIDQIIDRLLHTTQNKVEIALWAFLPSAPGIGLSTDADGEHLVKRVDRISGSKDVALSDIAGYDWSIQEWEILLDARVRCKLQEANETIEKLIMNRAHCLCRSVWAVPSGNLYSQQFRGVVKSGTFNTSSTNSRIRVMLAWLIGAMWAIAMGDDCLEEPVDGAEDEYKRYGHPLKMYEVSRDFEFCSHDFDRATGNYAPADPTKSLFSLLSKRKDGHFDLQALHSFMGHIRNHHSREIFKSTLLSLATGVHPEAVEIICDAKPGKLL